MQIFSEKFIKNNRTQHIIFHPHFRKGKKEGKRAEKQAGKEIAAILAIVDNFFGLQGQEAGFEAKKEAQAVNLGFVILKGVIHFTEYSKQPYCNRERKYDVQYYQPAFVLSLFRWFIFPPVF